MENNSSEKENCLNVSTTPTAYLSDVDDISDIDVEDCVDKLHKTITSKPERNSRRSIFNVTLEQLEMAAGVSSIDNEVEAYKQRVMREKQDWESFVQKILEPGAVAMRIGVGKTPEIASYKPNSQQQAYLKQGPNLQNFIRDSKAFMNFSLKFQHEFEKIDELQADLKDCCQFYAHKMQRDIIAGCLARDPRCQ